MSKISRIYVRNIKSIREEVLNLNGCTAIVIAGNDKGKTTLLNILPDRLRSEKVPIVLRSGEKEGVAEIELTTGEKFIYEVKEGGKEKLTFITDKGIKAPSSREISRRYFAEKFDIDNFLSESQKGKSKILQKIFNIDFSKLDKFYDEAYQERAIANRFIRDNEREALEFNEDLPKELINVEEIAHKMAALSSLEEKIGSVIGAMSTLDREIDELADMKERKEREREGMRRDLEQYNKAHDRYPTDAENSLNSSMSEAREKNNIIINNNRNGEKKSEYLKHVATKEMRENEMAAIEESKKRMLKDSNLPDGIEITDDGVFVDGFPLNKHQISLSKIYITALKIASMNLAKVKCLYFDASPLDNESLSKVVKWSEENDYQLLIERPDFDGCEIKYEIIGE